MQNKLIVPVSNNEVQFNEVAFKSRYAWRNDYITIELDMNECMAAHIEQCVPSPDQWDEIYYPKKMKGFENSHNSPIETAFVHGSDYHCQIKHWFKADELFIRPSITYTGGRHRNMLLQYLGATKIFVTVQESEIAYFRENFTILNEIKHSV